MARPRSSYANIPRLIYPEYRPRLKSSWTDKPPLPEALTRHRRRQLRRPRGILLRLQFPMCQSHQPSSNTHGLCPTTLWPLPLLQSTWIVLAITLTRLWRIVIVQPHRRAWIINRHNIWPHIILYLHCVLSPQSSSYHGRTYPGI